jgi:hypothetical protein
VITRIDPEYAAVDERSTLESFLEWYRASLVMKAQGLTDAEVRMASCPPSDLTLLGLVRHMAEVERNWFRKRLLGEDVGPIWYGEAHPDGDPDGDLHPGEDDSLADAMSVWETEVASARDIASRHGLDDEAVAERQRDDGSPWRPTLRWIYVHMIEEYARHCGHADLLRQRIDGAVGE